MNRPISDSGNVKRLPILSDVDVELPLVIRYAIFGLACVTYFSFMLVCNQRVQMPDSPIQDFFLRALEDASYWLPGFFFLAPLAIHDFIKSCGRVSKPIVRLRNEMKLLIDHKSDRPIEVRSSEAWPEVLAHYNHIRGELLRLRREVSEYEAMLGSAAIGDLNQPAFAGDTEKPSNTDSPGGRAKINDPAIASDAFAPAAN
jgi:hypothetical protein